MPLSSITPHPDRIALSNELHARPFPVLQAPSRAASIAVERDATHPDSDRDHLIALLDRYGAPHPAPDAAHHGVDLGKVHLKWERHSEFNTYTLFADGLSEVPFDGALFDYFSDKWLAASKGRLLSSVLVRLEYAASEQDVSARVAEVAADWFHAEATAASFVLERGAAIVGDFRLDAKENIRFAVFQIGATGANRMGRIVQRLIEIETYKAMSMLTLPIARDVFARLSDLDRDLGQVVNEMTDTFENSHDELDRLLDISSRVESFSADTAYRFTAAEAYSALVHQRVTVLHEERLAGYQLFSEFMMRRFEPAMRTCQSASKRLADISARAARASDLLSTRVSVDANDQNRRILKQMDTRAALQLRLQETVEGLSVVAISYYAVNLLAKLLDPVAGTLHISSKLLGAGLVVPVVLVVWLMVRNIRKLAEKRANGAIPHS
nr:DUF3422 domain-containing protein [Amylibacter sp.]